MFLFTKLQAVLLYKEQLKFYRSCIKQEKKSIFHFRNRQGFCQCWMKEANLIGQWNRVFLNAFSLTWIHQTQIQYIPPQKMEMVTLPRRIRAPPSLLCIMLGG